MKELMLARNYANKHKFPVAEFQEVVAGMRRLLTVCNALVTASAVNSIHVMQEIDEGVIQLVEDCGKKLTNTLDRKSVV